MPLLNLSERNSSFAEITMKDALPVIQYVQLTIHCLVQV